MDDSTILDCIMETCYSLQKLTHLGAEKIDTLTHKSLWSLNFLRSRGHEPIEHLSKK